jgi:alkanesulfonate monooxygenase SsuD/methylene tetrahydromethanopterin reductase-like flavin-dependent oxidoreductase (luciferase family)
LVRYSLAMNAPALEVGVLLAPRPEELGEWLADARAFEAAGAAALWVDPDPETGLDPLALLAALAALTSEALLVALPPAAGDRPAAALAGTLATVARLSHGRLALAADADRLGELTALLPGCDAFRRLPGTPPAFQRLRGAGEAEGRTAAAERLPGEGQAGRPGRPAASGHERGAGDDPAERWVQVAAPESRVAWRAALADAAAAGAAGLLVPAGPRLLDILRHPEDPQGRQDLQLAQG